MTKKIIALILICLMAFFITSCKGNSNKISRPTAEYEVNNENLNEGEWYEEETDEEETEPEDDDEDEYIIPDSDTKKVTKSTLKGMSDRELKLACNEIYARHGRIFKDKEIRDYFESKSWYEGTIEPEDFSESLLNSVEKYNAHYISEYRKNRNSPKPAKKNINNNNNDNQRRSPKTYTNNDIPKSNNNNNNTRTCKVCYGSGDCMKCGGTGNCSTCNGRGRSVCNYCRLGKCGACSGTGKMYDYRGLELVKVNCRTCGGDGKCTHCHGDAYISCVICKGSTYCYICDGSGRCGNCGGDGIK